MGSNTFGKIFQITTWGESHGPAIGVVIDGCPAGLAITAEEIAVELKRRAPGLSPYTSPRKEEDSPQILSGVFEGRTTGAPISLVIWNQDAHSAPYEKMKDVLRPGHANFTYLQKYGVFDYRGGGRSSARETVCRVAAGAIAKKILKQWNIEINARVSQVGAETEPEKMTEILEKCLSEGDSVGAVIEFTTSKLPVGLGDPVYAKLEAKLAEALLSLPATKGFEVGRGFAAATLHGSQHNDTYSTEGLTTNHSGGTLGGISNGESLFGRVAFKPTSSIAKAQQTVTTANQPITFSLPEGSRHDPCVALRAVPIVEAMVALVLVDALLMNRSAQL